MSGIKKIREYYGLTQQELAVFMDVSLSLLAMAETNKRILPTAALLKLSMLETSLLQNVTTLDRKPSGMQQKVFNRQLSIEIQKLQYQMANLQKKLKIFQKKHIQALRKDSLKGLITSKKIIKGKDMAWLNVLEADAIDTIKNTHVGMQTILQIKIDAMESQVKALSNLF